MRNAFAEEITALGRQYPELLLLSGDIGNRLFDDFKKLGEERFFNCGVAEANMMGVAAGLALNGFRPFVYTITPFVTTRCMEQIRVDVCYHEAPVVIVGTGSGLSYANLGSTHHSLEEIAMLRALPGMSVACPGDSNELRAVLRDAACSTRPMYIRIGKKGEPKIHPEVPDYTFGKGIELTRGERVCILSTGTILPVAVEACRALNQRGISAGHYSFISVKPLDHDLLSTLFDRYQLVVSVEEHSVIGGFGGALAEWRCDNPGARARLLRIGTEDRFLHEAGEQEHARELFGLTTESIVERASRALAP